MKKVLVMPVLAAVLFAAACGDDGDLVAAGPTGSVRFVNATTGVAGSGGFTANGQFATGSALASGQSAQSCAKVEAGSASFGFGAANTGGTGLSGNALTSLDNQSITAGGNYTVAAAGSAPTPTLFLLDNDFSGSMAANEAAVRFVNLAPGTGTTANNFTVLKGVLGQGHTLVQSNIAVGAPTTFNAVAGGSKVYTILKGHETVISGSAATLNLQAGTVNTAAIVPNTSGGFQLVNVPRC
jgi:hypothetical protein